MKTRIEWKMVNWPAVLFLGITPPAALILNFIYLRRDGFQWPVWLLAAFFYAATASSVTAGYHRLFAHRTYEAKAWVKWLWALFGAASFQNSILIWARDHRIHHRHVDSDLDPYSINKGFFYAHFGWMLSTAVPDTNLTPFERDLRRDPIVAFQDRHYVLLAVLVGFALPTLLGWALGSALGGFALAGLARIVLLHHMTFFVNSWCHWWGKQTYTDTNTAKDSFLMAVATFGEGYHNFHHFFAGDYRNGVRWYHWDPTKWCIALLSVLRGAHGLKRTPWGEIVAAKMRMDEKRLQQSFKVRLPETFQNQLNQIRARVDEAHARFEKIRVESRARWDVYARDRMRSARLEFRAALKEWRAYLRFLRGQRAATPSF